MAGGRPIDKYDWLKALGRYRGLSDCYAVLRVGIELFNCYNSKLGYAYPSRKTLSERLSIPPSGISKAIRKLKEAGAISPVPVRRVNPDVLKVTKRTAPRAQYYRLNFEWARQVLEDYPD